MKSALMVSGNGKLCQYECLQTPEGKEAVKRMTFIFKYLKPLDVLLFGSRPLLCHGDTHAKPDVFGAIFLLVLMPEAQQEFGSNGVEIPPHEGSVSY